MAGTDQSREAVEGGPGVVLVHPQLGENIGAAARAMYNFGLTDMHLVAPRDGWPNETARSMASGADWVLDRAQLHDTVEQAIGAFHCIYATTARDRHMVKPVMTAEAAARDMRARRARGERVGLLFGGERAGLSNDHVALADVLVTIPVNPAFGSLNLAQAVLLLGYEWFKQGADAAPVSLDLHGTQTATRAQVLGFFEHLEGALDRAGFFYPPEKRPAMVRNLRNLWHRVELTQQDVQTLRGLVVALSGYKPGADTVDGDA